MPECSQARPLKTLHDRRLAYLVSLEKVYSDMGYSTRLNGRDNLLEVYPAGVEVPKTVEEAAIEKWID